MSCIFVRLPGNMYKKANVYRMANDTIIKFIELYRSCECLWNVSSEDYGSRLSRNTAYDTISRKMRIPGFGPREVARKIKNLKSAYEREVKRIEDSEKHHGTMGSAYRPEVIWFDMLDDFLRDSGKRSQSDNQTESLEKALSDGEREKSVTNPSKKLTSDESSSNEMEQSPRSRKKDRQSTMLIVPPKKNNGNETETKRMRSKSRSTKVSANILLRASQECPSSTRFQPRAKFTVL